MINLVQSRIGDVHLSQVIKLQPRVPQPHFMTCPICKCSKSKFVPIVQAGCVTALICESKQCAGQTLYNVQNGRIERKNTQVGGVASSRSDKGMRDAARHGDKRPGL